MIKWVANFIFLVKILKQKPETLNFFEYFAWKFTNWHQILTLDSSSQNRIIWACYNTYVKINGSVAKCGTLRWCDVTSRSILYIQLIGNETCCWNIWDCKEYRWTETHRNWACVVSKFSAAVARWVEFKCWTLPKNLDYPTKPFNFLWLLKINFNFCTFQSDLAYEEILKS